MIGAELDFEIRRLQECVDVLLGLVLPGVTILTSGVEGQGWTLRCDNASGPGWSTYWGASFQEAIDSLVRAEAAKKPGGIRTTVEVLNG